MRFGEPQIEKTEKPGQNLKMTLEKSAYWLLQLQASLRIRGFYIRDFRIRGRSKKDQFSVFAV